MSWSLRVRGFEGREGRIRVEHDECNGEEERNALEREANYIASSAKPAANLRLNPRNAFK